MSDPWRDASDLDEWRESRKQWDPVDSKVTLAWGARQADSLWQNLYARWDPVIDGRTVLDLGCHWGFLLKLLLERHQPKKLIGVDILPLWEEIREWDWRVHSGVLELYHGDLLTVDIEEESLDLILCSSMMEYPPPEVLDETLARAYRLLEPGGEMLLRTQVYTSYSGASLHRSYDLPYVHMFYGQRELDHRLATAGRPSPQYTNWLTATSYLAAFARAGFEVLDAKRLINRHSPAVQDQIARAFPIAQDELHVAHLEARLLKPVGADQLDRFGAVLDQSIEHGLTSEGAADS